MGCLLFGSKFGLFRVPGFSVSLVGFKKKDGRKKRYKGKERRNKTRKKEREEEGIERKKIIIKIKNYLKKKKEPSLLASNWSGQFCWSFCL